MVRSSPRRTHKPPASIRTALSEQQRTNQWGPILVRRVIRAWFLPQTGDKRGGALRESGHQTRRTPTPWPTQNPSRTPRLHTPHFLSSFLSCLRRRHDTPLPKLYVSIVSSIPAVLYPASPPLLFNLSPPTALRGTIHYCYIEHA